MSARAIDADAWERELDRTAEAALAVLGQGPTR